MLETTITFLINTPYYLVKHAKYKLVAKANKILEDYEKLINNKNVGDCSYSERMTHKNTLKRIRKPLERFTFLNLNQAKYNDREIAVIFDGLSVIKQIFYMERITKEEKN